MELVRNKIQIRTAKNADYKSIYQIWVDGLRNFSTIDELDINDLTKQFKQNFKTRNGIFNFWVAEFDKEIIGWQAFIIASNNPLRKNICAESSTYISKNCQIQGIGELLMNFAINEAEKSHLEFIQGFVSERNTSARKLTAKTGWIEIGKIPASLKSKSKHHLPLQKIYMIRQV